MVTMNYSKRFIFTVLILAIASAAGLAQSVATPSLAGQAANVTEFDVNGLKVILKRRESSPTVSVGLFLRGGVRNYTDKTAGIENLMLNSAVEAGQTKKRQAVRRELARNGRTNGGSASSGFRVGSIATNPDQLYPT